MQAQANTASQLRLQGRRPARRLCCLVFILSSFLILDSHSALNSRPGRGSPMNSDVVCGGSAAAGFEAKGFQDEPLLAGAGLLTPLPRNGLPVSSGFGAGVKTCFVLDHIVAGAEPILLSIEG
jgi:hypothetical protein